MSEGQFYKKRFLISIFLIITIFVIGVSGYSLIESWGFVDSLYMTTITLTTVGFSEVHPLSTHGRFFTMFLIIAGLSISGYSLSIVVAFIVEGDLGRLIKGRKMEKLIQKLTNHYILCGAGETGRCIIDEFVKTKTPFVVIDYDKEKIAYINSNYKIPTITGDATKDAILRSAGIERAQGLISALHSDRDNVFVVLTARAINERIRIVSRVVEPESEHKIRMAGADNIVSPNYIGGLRMASLMIRPAVVSFLDVMMRDQTSTMRLEEIVLPKKSHLVGLTLRESDIGRRIGLIVIAIKSDSSDRYVYNPKPDTQLQVGDTFVVMGDVDQITSLRNLANSEIAQ